MALEGVARGFIIGGVIVLGVCVICVFVPIIGWVDHNCVDMEYVTMPYNENKSGQVYCSLTANVAESVRVQLQAPSEELFVMLLSDGSKIIPNYTYEEYKSEYEYVSYHECSFIMSIVNQEKGKPIKVVTENVETLDLFLVDNEVTSGIYSYDYYSSDFYYYEGKSVFGIRGTNMSKLWNYGNSYRYEIYVCNPTSTSTRIRVTVSKPEAGFDTSQASLVYSDVEDVTIPLSKNVSSGVEQHIVVQYTRLSGEPSLYSATSAVLIDYTTSHKYRWATLGSYIGLCSVGLILILIGIAILAAPMFFVRHFGSNNLRNETQPLNTKVKQGNYDDYDDYPPPPGIDD